MAKDLTGFRVAHADLIDFSSGTRQSQELDFNFARGEGIAIYSISFLITVNEIGIAGGTDNNFDMTVHVENDTLEVTMHEVPADGFTQDDSEIIAEASWGSYLQDEAATTGGSAATIGWLSRNHFDYLQMIGSPLVIAINPTLSGRGVGTTFLVDDLRMTMWYKYVELSDKEIRDAFFRRR